MTYKIEMTDTPQVDLTFDHVPFTFIRSLNYFVISLEKWHKTNEQIVHKFVGQDDKLNYSSNDNMYLRP